MVVFFGGSFLKDGRVGDNYSKGGPGLQAVARGQDFGGQLLWLGQQHGQSQYQSRGEHSRKAPSA